MPRGYDSNLASHELSSTLLALVSEFESLRRAERQLQRIGLRYILSFLQLVLLFESLSQLFWNSLSQHLKIDHVCIIYLLLIIQLFLILFVASTK